MSIEVVFDALALPTNSLVNQRIPKKLLVEQGAPTAADKRQIQDCIEELHWVAALKPSNIGIPPFQNEEREYLEIAVLNVVFRQNAKVPRLIELIHRAIPYPLLLVSSVRESDSGDITISAAHKRFALNEAGKIVVDEVLSVDINMLDALRKKTNLTFLNSLALDTLPKRNMFVFYQGWLNCIVGLSFAMITGKFTLPDSPEQAHRMREFSAEYLHTLDELCALKILARKEKQINRLVELNLKIKQLEIQLTKSHSI